MTQVSGKTEDSPSVPPSDGVFPQRGSTHTQADGILEMVDLRAGTFLVRDDVGHAFELDGVANADTACRYVGLRVQVHGASRTTDDGSVRFEPGSEIHLVEMPESWFFAGTQDVEAMARSAHGPDLDGGIELTDDELKAFLAAVHG